MVDVSYCVWLTIGGTSCRATSGPGGTDDCQTIRYVKFSSFTVLHIMELFFTWLILQNGNLSLLLG
jgi:hypothetical protein